VRFEVNRNEPARATPESIASARLLVFACSDWPLQIAILKWRSRSNLEMRNRRHASWAHRTCDALSSNMTGASLSGNSVISSTADQQTALRMALKAWKFNAVRDCAMPTSQKSVIWHVPANLERIGSARALAARCTGLAPRTPNRRAFGRCAADNCGVGYTAMRSGNNGFSQP
jgi:hypothetical protein